MRPTCNVPTGKAGLSGQTGQPYRLLLSIRNRSTLSVTIYLSQERARRGQGGCSGRTGSYSLPAANPRLQLTVATVAMCI